MSVSLSILSIAILATSSKAFHVGPTTSVQTSALFGSVPQPTKQNEPESESSRRNFMQDILSGTFAATTASLVFTPEVSFAEESAAAAAITTSEDIEVYFGCGCFWHVQHELVEAERNILKRSDESITARAGYAGGKAGAGKDGKVCYHNGANVADYGKLGHAEVVRVKVPAESFEDFAVEYFKLFDSKGNRPDQSGDRGLEYRNLVGIPGGAKSDLGKQLVAASIKTGDKLDFAIGKGDDPDKRAVTFVMDTEKYPFFVGEQYHQFHDGFNLGENYPNSYNGLAGKMAKDGSLEVSKCPNGMLGLGALGL